MGFTFSKREKILAIVLGSAIYIFIFIKFILMSAMPGITSAMLEIGTLKSQKAALDNDVVNIGMLKANLHMKEIGNQRLDNYLMDSASITDSIEYIQKLSEYFGKEIVSINISKPEPKTAAGANINAQSPATASTATAAASSTSTTSTTAAVAAPTANTSTSTSSASGPTQSNEATYFEFNIAFNCAMTFAEVDELAQFIEGGSQKVRIKELSLQPLVSEADKKITSRAGAATSPSGISQKGGVMYNCSFKIAFYSMNLGSLDNMYEFSKDRFNLYETSAPIAFFSSDYSDASTKTTGKNSGNTAKSGNSLENSYLHLNEVSFLAAGNNLRIYGDDKPDGGINLATKTVVNVELTLNDANYTIKTIETSGRTLTTTGSMPDLDFSIGINIDFPQVPDNKALGLKFRIVNNSTKNVNIFLVDAMKKATIVNRGGKIIYARDDTEKVNIQ